MSDDEVFVQSASSLPPESDLINGGASASTAAMVHHRSRLGNSLSDDPKLLRSNLVKDPAARRSPCKKIVSFSSMPAEKKISCATDCLTYMQAGSNLIKVKSGTRRYRRCFCLDDDYAFLRWTPTSKKADRAKIPVDAIREIRVGRNTENLRNSDSCFEELAEDCAFSIIWGDDYQCLDLIANTPDEANIWITGLVALTSGNLGHNLTSSSTSTSFQPAVTLRDSLLEKFFQESALSCTSSTITNEQQQQQEHHIDEKGVVALIQQLNPRLPVNKILQKAKEYDNLRLDDTPKGQFSQSEFCEIYRDLTTRPEVYFLMVRYANKDYLTAEDLHIFLETEQGISGASLDICQQLIRTYEPFKEAADDGHMTVDGFTNYLLSPECDLFDPVHRKVCQDMSQPFTNYFLSTSYNTYLAEDQMKGPSSAEAYAHALKMGCRFVELDVWENEDDPTNEPVVYHGHTMTSRLPVRKALTTIKAHAFSVTQYPLIVQIENHLEPPSQRTLASLLKDILGDILYINDSVGSGLKTSNDIASDRFTFSPEQFKGKVLLKGKKIDTYEQEEAACDVSDEDESAETTRSTRCMKKSHSFMKRRILCKELSDLICQFLRSTTLIDFPTIMNRQSPQQVCSINEAYALKLAAHYSQDFVSYTCKYLTRVFPNSVRVDSSNMNPQEFWNCGCQLVALNFQTPGLMMDLLRGKFSANGNCGYVLKPLVMREPQAYFSPRDTVLTMSSQTLHLKIISAQQLRRPRGSTAKGDSLDPFIIIEVFGLPCDCAEERTKTVQNESFNPVFDESFQFDISLPELAIVRFLVLDDDYISDDFIGQYSIPFDCLQSGYRYFTLLDINGEPMEHSTLFVHVAITNKRGGGKARKRGMSVRRRHTRIHTGIKQVGVKQLDDTFKASIPALTECIQLRTGLENDLVQWQESCGLGPAATMRQGLRLIYSRLAAANVNTSNNETPLQMVIAVDDGYPVIELEGNVPDILRKSCQSFERLVLQCRRIIERSDSLTCKVEEFARRITDCYDEVCSERHDMHVKGQQATRASENFAWNLRLVKSQAEIMCKIQEECREHIKQIINTACLLNVLKNQCQQPCQHRNQQINNI